MPPISSASDHDPADDATPCSAVAKRWAAIGDTPISRRVAYLIGIDRYDLHGEGIPRLHSAVADAKALARVLRRLDYDVTTFLDEQASHQRLSDLFERELPSTTHASDQVVIHFAGHGLAEVDMAEDLAGFLLPCDARREAPTTFLPMEAIQRALAGLRCHHLLVLLDCCFAGVFGSRREVRVPDRKKLTDLRARYYARRRALQVLASTAYDQLAIDRLAPRCALDGAGSPDEDGSHSPFASALLDALGPRAAADYNADGIVTAVDLHAHVSGALATMFQREGIEQTPTLRHLDWHADGEFMFLVGPPSLEHEDDALPLASNPYRGLEPFSLSDRAMFFGRDDFVHTLSRLVATHRLTVVLGTSGSGKSSAVQAGLLPALARTTRFRLFGPMRPGPSPLDALLSAARSPNAELEAARREVPEEALLLGDAADLLVIDQFEEIFTRCDEHARTTFLALLFEAVATPSDLRVVLTLRSDYEAHLLEAVPHYAEGPERCRVFVPPMNREQLRSCIEGPAANKVMFLAKDERGDLVKKLLDEVDKMPGALPLLSVTLAAMYTSYARSRRTDRTLGWAEYEAVGGGVVGAIQHVADSIYDRRTDGAPSPATDPAAGDIEAYRATLRRVVLRMLAPTGGGATRRRVEGWELAYADREESLRIADVRGRLTAARLAISGAAQERLSGAEIAPGEDDAFIEPAHDALLVHWPRFQDWVKDRGAALAELQRVTTATRTWLLNNRSVDLLWSEGLDLRRLRHLVTRGSNRRDRLLHSLRERFDPAFVERSAPSFTFNDHEAEFIRSSLRVARTKLLRRMALSLAAVSLLAAAGILLRREQLRREMEVRGAEQEKEATARDAAVRVKAEQNVAVARDLASRAEGLLSGAALDDLAPALLVGVESLKHHRTPEGDRVVRRALALLFTRDEITAPSARPLADLAMDGDGKVTVTVDREGIVRALRGSPLETRQIGGPGARCVGSSADGRRIVVGRGRDVEIWEAADSDAWTMKKTWTTPDLVDQVALSGRLSWVLTTHGSTQRLWDTRDGSEIAWPRAHEHSLGPVRQIVVSPTEEWLAVVHGGLVPPRDPEPRRLQEARGGESAELWSTTTRRTARLPIPVSGEPPEPIKLVPPVAFSPNGSLVASATARVLLAVWQLDPGKTPRLRSTMSASKIAQAVSRLAFGERDGSPCIAAGTTFGGAHVWKLGDSAPEELLSLEARSFASFWQPVEAVALDAESGTLALAFRGSGTRVLRVGDRKETGRVLGYSGPVRTLAFDGPRRLVVRTEAEAGAWSGEMGGALQRFPAHEYAATIAFSREARWLAFPAAKGSVSVVRRMNGEKVYLGAPADRLLFDPSTDELLAMDDQGIERWSVADRARVKNRLPFPDSNFSGSALAIDPSGKTAAVIAHGGARVRTYDLTQWSPGPELDVLLPQFANSGLRLPHIAGPVDGFARSLRVAAGSVAVTYGDGSVAVFVDHSPPPVVVTPPTSDEMAAALGVQAIAFSPDGTRLAAAGPDGVVHVWRREGSAVALQTRFRLDGAIDAMEFTPNGASLATASIVVDSSSGEPLRSVQVWSCALGAPETTLEPFDTKIGGLAFSAKGDLLATIGGSEARVFVLGAGALRALACARSSRELTDDEWRAYLPKDEPKRGCNEEP